MIYVTGDTHIPHDIHKLNSESFPQQKNMDKNDYVIICGDFGGIFRNDSEEKYWLKWLKDKPWITLWLDGNHENFTLLETFPIETKFGSKVHKINDSIYHLMRGHVYTIENKKFFVMGGASSTDKEFRTEKVTWWHQEIPSAEEFKEGISNLKINNWSIDYILTHTCSSTILNQIAKIFGFQPKPEDEVNKYLDIIEKECKYKYWYFGHFHEDIKIDDTHTLVYEKIIRIE